MKRVVVWLLTCVLTAGLTMTACSSPDAKDINETSTEQTVEDEASTEADDEKEAADTDNEEEEDTGDASLDDPRNQNGIGKNEVLVVSFGTSFNDNRRLTIGAIETAIEESIADIADGTDDWSVRRAFTSQIIIDHVNDRDGEKIDNVEEALERAVANDVENLHVVVTHLMDGYEYSDLMEALGDYADAFISVTVSKPLLSDDSDFAAVATAVLEATADYDDGETAIVFMGHGTEAASNGVYEKMQQELVARGAVNYYVGTVEATPTLDDVVAKVKEGDYQRVVLMPLMVVAGDHANNDMAGDDDDSWKSVFEQAGYEVECLLQGLGQNAAVQELYVEHFKASLADSRDVTQE